MGFGLGVLRLAPDAFWRMTPRELAAAIEALVPRRAVPLGRHAFDALMRRFPDRCAAQALSERAARHGQASAPTGSSDSSFPRR